MNMTDSDLIKYYDAVNRRLVYLAIQADDTYWDSHWEIDEFEKHIKNNQNKFIVRTTQKYLPIGSKVLEGGCGRGDKVYALQLKGFNSYGVDFATETIKKINRYAPELKVTLGDVENLDFPDEFFDGYWSLGVIEHFYQGYELVLLEMKRVLKKGGMLFVTVPVMSWLRRQKAILGIYPEYKETSGVESVFYQFAFNPNDVIDKIQDCGFQLVFIRKMAGLKGWKDEIPFLKSFHQKIFENRNSSFLVRVLSKILEITTTPLANHIQFYVFMKK
jgi:ubiquinone/menaquinone biosynthesis C-methylase UbiE